MLTEAERHLLSPTSEDVSEYSINRKGKTAKITNKGLCSCATFTIVMQNQKNGILRIAAQLFDATQDTVYCRILEGGGFLFHPPPTMLLLLLLQLEI